LSRMLVRAYRLTDKVGIAILKSSEALADHTLAGLSIITRVGGRGFGGLFGGLFVLILGIGRIIYLILRRIALILLAVLGFFARIFGRVFAFSTGTAQRSSSLAIRSAGASANDMMARRAARAEMEVGLAEDPLRVQNR